jgi:hypothetical protein
VTKWPIPGVEDMPCEENLAVTRCKQTNTAGQKQSDDEAGAVSHCFDVSIDVYDERAKELLAEPVSIKISCLRHFSRQTLKVIENRDYEDDAKKPFIIAS